MGSGIGKQRRARSVVSSPRPREHPQVVLRTPEGEAVEVDQGIAALIEALWSRGMRTTYSCEGTPPSPGDAGSKGYFVVTGMSAAREILSCLLDEGSPVREEAEDISSEGRRSSTGKEIECETKWVYRADCSMYAREYLNSEHDRFVFRFPTQSIAAATEAIRATPETPAGRGTSAVKNQTIRRITREWEKTLAARRQMTTDNLSAAGLGPY